MRPDNSASIRMLILAFVLCSALICSASAHAAQWVSTYGGVGSDYATEVLPTQDGGFIVAGYTNSYGQGGFDAWVMKLDADGAVSWQITYGGTDNDYANSIGVATGGYFVAGHTHSIQNNTDTAWVMKLDTSGAVVWSKAFGGETLHTNAATVRATLDRGNGGGCIVAGKAVTSPATTSDAWVMKLDGNGAVTWQKTYGGTGSDSTASITQTSDGDYIVAGQTDSSGQGGSDAWLLKLDANGGVTWQKTYGGGQADVFNSVLEVTGGYLAAGMTQSFGSGGSDAWLVKMDTGGTVVWQKTYGEGDQDSASAIRRTPDNGYVMVGSTFDYGDGSEDVWLLKLDVTGTIQWQRVYWSDYTDSDKGLSIQPTFDGGYVVAGSTHSFYGSTMLDALVIKIDANGNVTGCPNIASGFPPNATVDASTAIGTVSTATAASPPVTAQAWSPQAQISGTVPQTSCHFSGQWFKSYGGSGNDRANAVQPTFDGGYVIAGETTSYGSGGTDAWVVKLDQHGGILWQKAFGGSYEDRATSVHADSTAIWVGGKTALMDAVASEAWIAKLDHAGGVTWHKTLAGGDSSVINSIQQTSDGGCIAAGTYGSDVTDAWLLKLDSLGNIVWQNRYGGAGSDSAASVQQTVDGGYIMAGKTQFFGNGSIDLWVVKLDSNGAVTWQRAFGPGEHGASSVMQTSDGGYIVAGYQFNALGFTDAWVLRLTAAGDTVWQKSFGSTTDSAANAVRQSSDGGFIVAGQTGGFIEVRGIDAWLLRLDGDGEIQWQKTYGSLNDEMANAVQQTVDGGYIVAGSTTTTASGDSDAWVLKLDSSGNLTGCLIGKPSTAAGVDTMATDAATATAPVAVNPVPGFLAPYQTTSTAVPHTYCDYSGQWAKAYNGSEEDGLYSTQQTMDGGYIVAGTTKAGSSSRHAWVMKLDPGGIIQWNRTYAFGSFDAASSIRQTMDGGYIVTGGTTLAGQTNSTAWVMKLDQIGNITWQKTYGGAAEASAYAIQQTGDGGYIVAGNISSNDTVGYDTWILKLDATGVVSWQNIIGGAGYDMARSVYQTADNGYIVAGVYDLQHTGGGKAWVLKLSSNGHLVWQRTYGGTGTDMATSVQQTSDNSFIVAGVTDSFGNGGNDVWVFKLDTIGDIQWQKTVGGAGEDVAFSVQQTNDGGYIVGGTTTSYGNGELDLWILKISQNGTSQWQRTFGGPGSENYGFVRQTTDNGYIVAGMASPPNMLIKDGMMLKLDSSGDLTGCSQLGASNASVLASGATIAIPTVTEKLGTLTNADASTVVAAPAIIASVESACSYLACTFHVAPQSVLFAPAGGSGSVMVSGSRTCNWIATSDVPWITINSGSGKGNDLMTYSVAANTDLARTGTITVGDQIFSVTGNSLLRALTISPFGGSGSGSVHSTPGGIACIKGIAAGCKAGFPADSTVNLSATPDWNSLSSEWKGDCSGTVNPCSITMNRDRYVSLTLDPNYQAILAGAPGTGYAMLQDAYGATGNGSTILAHVHTFHENLLFTTKTGTVTLDGGKDPNDGSYQATTGYTTVQGSLHISDGRLNVRNIRVR